MLVALDAVARDDRAADQPLQGAPRFFAAIPLSALPRARLPAFRSVDALEAHLLAADAQAVAVDHLGTPGNRAAGMPTERGGWRSSRTRTAAITTSTPITGQRSRGWRRSQCSSWPCSRLFLPTAVNLS